jgi:hypothetical protein
MPTNQMNLASCAVLVEFNASVWTARKLDRSVSDEIEQSKGAKSKGAARVNKNLFAGRSELEEIRQLVTAARTYVYDNTFPWSDAGQRLLPTGKLIAVDARMQQFRDEFNAKVANFVAVYPTLITAQAMALGDMFKRDEYPSAHEIAGKFAFMFEPLPVPQSGDFRVDVGNEAQQYLEERLRKTADARINRVLDDVRQRLAEHLQRMSDRLVTERDDKTGEPKQRKFNDTLVTGAYELCDLIKSLPALEGHDLAVAARALENALDGKDAQALRDMHDKRDEVKAKVDALISQYDF